MRIRQLYIRPELLLLLLTLSCEKITTWDIQPSDQFPVVDCIITNELKYQELTLYLSAKGLNQNPEAISGAVITMNDGISTLSFSEIEPGKYRSAEPFMASAGNEYTLSVTCRGITAVARAEMVAITPLESLEIVARDSLFRFVYHSGNQPSMTEVFYDWSAVPGYCESYGSCQASEVFYTLDNIDVSKMFAPDRIIIPFPKGTQIIRRKYSLSKDHQQFIRSLLLETDWRGGLFDVEQGNVPTNFSSGMRGWFATCMVLSDTTYFE
jgi:hypothetical protein